MIEINNLHKTINGKDILKNVNMKVPKGSILALVGPNGAGKSTLIRCLTGIYSSDEGGILYDGEPIYENPKVKENLGFVADENNFFYTSKIKDVIKYYSMLYKNFNMNKFNEINKIFKIDITKRVFQLSKGLKMRLAIMLALSISPKYLIMDEPTSGLDPIFKRKLLELIMDEVVSNGCTTIISTHNLNEIERICDSVAFVNEGTISIKGSLEDIRKKVRKLQVVFNESVEVEELYSEGIVKVDRIGRVYEIITKDYGEKVIEKINKFNPMFIEELNLSLEDIFIHTMEKEELIYEKIL